MGWFYIFLAAVFEVIGVLGLKLFSQERTMKHGVIYLGGLGGSFAFLYASFLRLQVSVAYAVFIGIGTAGAVLLNMIFFGESRNIFRILSLVAIIIGVVGLKALS
ncbi:QacE family quaternary ammonium compound efflux SMR transporter [Virgibacillus dakarensis]|uniref:QacE family quaternary ammonium compound efflux SMR transporter n=1 Tax=Lentibacillus populi TaxID=1827502 RepID=A0A9W5TWH1_9BACI|nr:MULTISPECIES: SMR family transporter [Bacillaceae]MTW86190.1 QacE family quaternary ammonium compound efflux SMR transporter [Virgibacillus dakarensis]GGB38552.1 QacE family quaternary ammonium compound efflux SMR transporter [Lentibacillus populi]